MHRRLPSHNTTAFWLVSQEVVFYGQKSYPCVKSECFTERGGKNSCRKGKNFALSISRFWKKVFQVFFGPGYKICWQASPISFLLCCVWPQNWQWLQMTILEKMSFGIHVWVISRQMNHKKGKVNPPSQIFHKFNKHIERFMLIPTNYFF